MLRLQASTHRNISTAISDRFVKMSDGALEVGDSFGLENMRLTLFMNISLPGEFGVISGIDAWRFSYGIGHTVKEQVEIISRAVELLSTRELSEE